MREAIIAKPQVLLQIRDAGPANGAFAFTFAPKASQHNPPANGRSARPPQYVVTVRSSGGQLEFDWTETIDDPCNLRAEVEEEIAARVKDRTAWVERITALIAQVEQWARELNWSTRRIEKKLDDARIGTHYVPALLIQEDTCRILLEPVGRSSPGTEGLADLYLMPAYDDIASLYYDANGWNLQYALPGFAPASNGDEADAVPLSKESLTKVLAELRQHAA